jgi:hypothetical protein
MAVCKRPNSGGPTNTVDSSNRISSSSEPQESLESVKKISLDLAKDVIPYLSNINASCAPLNEHAKTLRRTSDEICRRHEILFNFVRLNVIDNNVHDTGSSLKRVMDEMFTDGHFNWGRVVTVYAFAGSLARYCSENGKQDFVDSISCITGSYVSEKLSTWIHQQGGWDAFDRYFPEEDSTESAIWKGLLYTFLGLGALATITALK